MDRSRSPARESAPADSAAALDSPHSLHSDVRTLSFEPRRASLLALLERASSVEPAARSDFFESAHTAARSAVETSTNETERGTLLQLWTRLCLVEADTLAEPARSQKLQEALRRLEQSIQLSPSQSGVSRAVRVDDLPRIEAERAVEEPITDTGATDPSDWRATVARADSLTAQAQRADSPHSRALLQEACSVLTRGIESTTDAVVIAELSNRRGLAWLELASRSAASEAHTLALWALADYQRATERLPTLEAPWRNWSGLLLTQARRAPPERRAQLRLSALEVSWRGISAVTDPKAACRLSIQRGRALLELARQGTAAERETRLEEARQELERATERDRTNEDAWSGVTEALRAQAAIVDPERGRAFLERALELLTQGLEALNETSHDVARSLLRGQRGATLIALGELGTGAARTRRFNEALRQFELATRTCERNWQPWASWSELLCKQAQYADPESARELTTRAFDLLTRGLTRVRDAEAESALLDARGRVSLLAAELESGAERAQRAEEAVADFKHACDKHPGNVAAWRHESSALCARARRAGSREAALELWKQADEVLDAAVQRLPLGAATASLLTDRGDLFLAQATRATGSERRQCFERALACFEEATQLAPNYGAAWRSWGRAFAWRGRYDRESTPAESFRLAFERGKSAVDVLDLDQRGAVWVEFASELRALARRDVVAADPLVDELSVQLERAIAEEPPQRARYYLARGNLLRDAGRFAAAELDLERGRACGMPALEALYCQHDLSALRQDQGHPDASREWRRTQRAYESYCQTHEEHVAADVVGCWATLLYEAFGRSDEAEVKLLAALSRRAASATLFQRVLVELANERAQTDPSAQQSFLDRVRAAERFVRTDAIDQSERELQLGTLALRAGEHERAERHLERAVELDPWNARASEGLGLSALQQQRFELARSRLEQAHRHAPRDRTSRARFAAALAKCGELDAAREQYRTILQLDAHDVDALLGMTDACIGHADATHECESYERAIEHATAAIGCGHSQLGRRLRAAELAWAFYARGYARVKLASLAPDLLGVDHYGPARADFRSAAKLDPSHEAARRASSRLSAALGGSAVSRMQALATGVVCVLATCLFALAQLGFWSSASFAPWAGRSLDLATYLGLSFGALTFLVAGAYLPQVLKRSVASIDLERRPIEVGDTRRLTLDR